MNKVQFRLTLVFLIVSSFFGGALAVLILDSGPAEAHVGSYRTIGASGSQAWALNTTTGAIKSIRWSGGDERKHSEERHWNNSGGY